MLATTCTHEGIQLVDEYGCEACWDCGGVVFIPEPRGPNKTSRASDPVLRQLILDAVRGGVSPAIAAGAAGIKPETWRAWRSRNDEPYRTFFDHVRQAEMEAVAAALRVVKTTDAKAWLKHAAQIDGVWRETTKQVNVSVGGSGVPIQVGAAPSIDLSRLSNAELAQLEQMLKKAQPVAGELPEHVPADVIDVEAEPVE